MPTGVISLKDLTIVFIADAWSVVDFITIRWNLTNSSVLRITAML